MSDDDIEDLPRTIAALPFFAAGRFPKPDLLARCTAQGIAAIDAREWIERVRDLGLGLSTLGVLRGDRVALLSESRPEWLQADLATLALGAVTVPIYPTLAAEQVGFILQDSGARVVIVSTPAQLAKVVASAVSVPSLEAIVVLDGAAGETGSSLPVVAFGDVMAQGHRRILDGWGIGRAFHDDAKKVAPTDLATIIYTSGTTGQPKGVMLTHANLIANVEGIRQVVALDEDDVALSFLPLCHAFERTVAYVYLANGVSIVFAESNDTVARDLKVVRPTVMTAVPRVFEKLQARVLATGRESRGLKRLVFERAMRLAVVRGQKLTQGEPLSVVQQVESWLAERAVYRKVREGVGGRLRFVVSGSAPLRPDLGAFFHGVGVPVLEGYGLTETSPVVSVNPLERARLGTVGPPLPNVEVRLASDGEIEVRGPSVMSGYYLRPAETAAAFRDGWFLTGDIGSLDARGYLRITDRKKEIIVTSGGKKIAPHHIEAQLCTHPLVAEALVVGDGRHFAAALIVPDFPALAAAMGEGTPADEAARKRLAQDPRARALVEPVVDAVNVTLAQFEKIKRFAILPDEFTIAGGELTPTLKVKRRVVLDRWRDVVDQLYV